MTDRDHLLQQATRLGAGAHVTTDNAADLARGLLEIAEQAMPDTFFATDSRCILARAVLARVDRSNALDDFAKDILNKCRIAVRRRYISPAWSHGEQAAVAVVTRDREWCTENNYTAQEAAARAAAGLPVPTVDFSAWIDAIRVELYGDDRQ